MTVKEALAKLYAYIDKPIQEYAKQETAISMAEDLELLSKLEPFQLPEITKLICSSKNLTAHFGESYIAVQPYYEDTSIETMLERFSDESKDSSYYITSVFPFADSVIMDSFLYAYSKVEEAIQISTKIIEEQCKEVARLTEKIKEKEYEINEIEAELSLYPKGNNDEKKLKQKASGLKAARTKAYKELDRCQERIKTATAERENLLKQWERLRAAKEQAYQIKGTYSEALSKARTEAYAACDEKSIIQKLLNTYLNTNKLPDQLLSSLKNANFVVRFLGILDNEYPTKAVSVLAALYEIGAIDIHEGPVKEFLISHTEELSAFFLSNYMSIDASSFNAEKADFSSWLAFIIENSFAPECSSEDYRAFGSIWDSGLSVDCWNLIMNSILEFQETDFVDSLSKLLLHTSGISRKNLMSLTQHYIDDAMLDGLSPLVSSLIENHIPDDDCALIVEHYVQTMETKYVKLQNSNALMKFKSDRLSANVYGALADSLEGLEMLASNLSCKRENVSPELIAPRLKKLLISLREGLEDVVKISPLADPNDWLSQKEIPFDPAEHTINLSTPPQCVYLRTLGFSYQDSAGNTQTSPAIVGGLSEIIQTRAKQKAKGRVARNKKDVKRNDS